LLGIRP